MGSLFEKHRPRNWGAVVGQERAIKAVRTSTRDGVGGQAYWITGQSGTGKTTIARILAAELADAMNVEELDASDVTADWIRDTRRAMGMFGLGAKTGRAFIINEAHGLRRDIVRRMLTLLEEVPEHVAFIFTTTNDGQQSLFDGDDANDTPAFLSRAVPVRLAQRGLSQPFAERAREIATEEGLNGRPIESYVRLAKDCRNNLRRMLSEIAAGAMLA